jgi:leukotriene-A4 hydrolase
MHKDPHSFARPDEAAIKNLHLDLTVDFSEKTLSGRATLQIENRKGVNRFYLDSNQLEVVRVTVNNPEEPANFHLDPVVPYLGQPLIIEIKPDTRIIHIDYKTHPSAAALQWLSPAQTAGGKKPLLYTQSQTNLARSWVPCQDTPSVRMTYDARIRVPSDLMAVMSAENSQKRNATGVYEFRMPQPIPSYLLALAVGDIEFRPTGQRSGVYAEPSVVDGVAWEFAETEQMIHAVEMLYGPYLWGRYDVLVLPPSFPWAGMENPRLTFATPTVVVGDRSLVSLVAHELSHSWSGNLVTNATWNDFWLNEGFTNYLDHRVMEALHGKDHDDMLSVLSLQDLHREIEEIGPNSPDTNLKGNYIGRDPEDTATQIPYEKGQFFLRTIEAHVGRPRWDRFVKDYFQHFAFQSITTEEFMDYFRKNLIQNDAQLEKNLQIDAWVYGSGVPSNIIEVKSSRLEKVDQEMEAWRGGKPASQLQISQWSTQEWMHFIRRIPAVAGKTEMAELDSAVHFSDSQNSEILNEWLLVVIAKQYKPVYGVIEKFLSSNGRRKYVKQLLTALAKTPDGLQFGRQIYAKTRSSYHSVTRDIADRILNWKA